MINYIGFTRNKKDIVNSKKIIHKVFKGTKNQQTLILNNPDNLNKKNIIILEYNKKIIGTIRLVKKITINQKIRLKVLGISHVCILDKYRNRGFSKILMNYAIIYGKKNNYDISLLFARKALDKYYNKFDFFGLSSFPKFSLELKKISI